MRDLTLIFICAITLGARGEVEKNTNGCPTDFDIELLLSHDTYCNKFYHCKLGNRVERICPSGLVFNEENQKCDWPKNVDCENREIDEETNNGEGSHETENESKEDDNDGDDVTEVDDNNDGGNSDPSKAPALCAVEGSDGVLVAHENCEKFYKCFNGQPITLKCPANLLWNPSIEKCDWPKYVDCGDRVIPENEAENNRDSNETGESNSESNEDSDSESNGNNDSESNEDGNNNGENSEADETEDSEDNNSNGGGNSDPSEAPELCVAEGSDGVLVANEGCNKFYICANGLPVALKCPSGLFWNPSAEQCDWPQNVECGDRVVPDDEAGDNNNGDESGVGDNEGNEDGDSKSNEESDSKSNEDGDNNGENSEAEEAEDSEDNNGNGGGNSDPSEAPELCAAEGSDGVLVANKACNKFYICANGLPVALKCPSNLLWNPSTEKCDWPENVDCGDRVVPDNEAGDNNNGDESGVGDNEGNVDGDSKSHEESDSESKEDSDSESNGNSDSESNEDGDNNGENSEAEEAEDSEDNNGNGGGNSDPSEAPELCAAEGSDGVLVANKACNKFYICANGLPVALKCPSNLLWNPSTEKCDWPENVDCGDRVVPDNEAEDNNGNDEADNGNGGGNSDPSKAPELCAAEGSDGVLVANEGCNKFYICANGLPVALKCPSGLFWNPSAEQCEWPQNVECGDRVVPDNEAGDNNNGDESGVGDNEGNEDGNSKSNEESDSESNENSDSESNEDGDNNGENSEAEEAEHSEENNGNGGGNSDPSEAPELCAAEGSDGVLVANEGCNKFYICANGLPVALKCPSNLLWNPSTEKCDWPENVDCGDRVVPDNEAEDNNGNDEADNGNGGGNSDPSEAPELCAAEGSDGVLVANEGCNKFYICANGLPVALKCPSGLFWNPSAEQCDWPQNVECGDRVVPDNEAGDNNNGDESGVGDNESNEDGNSKSNEESDSESNENSDSESNEDGDNNGENSEAEEAEHSEENNGNGGGNSDPSEAPELCAAEGSDGVLVANEGCNKFYICANGLPVALKCPSNLLWNPSTEKCDWPENVDCGDRVVPDNEAEDNNGNDEADNGNGGGNSDPSEAPELCAAEGSDGVLVANEGCNKFYICANGLPVALKCPSGLFWNPSAEQCDWPQNVECGDRVVPDNEAGDNNNGDESGVGDNESNEDGDSKSNEESDSKSNEDGDNNGENSEAEEAEDSEDNNGNGGGNSDPSEAPELCAAEGSDGVLVANKACNKFYICANGLPVALKCPSNLLWNPSTEKCDWPENVDCGDRVVPDNEAEDNNGNDEADNGNGGGNSDPSEAPELCAAEGSDGVLVANEGCNKFYICANGLPVALKCPSGLFWNPSAEQCDWPQNVECGDRVVPDNEAGDNNNGDESGVGDNEGNEESDSESKEDSDSESNGNSDSESNEDGDNNGENSEAEEAEDSEDNNGNGGGNSDPSEAPELCAAEGSDGVLVANKACNKFYICANGLPVALKCPTNLLWNPSTEKCDWPENVDCGDRVVPDNEAEDNNGNDEADNGNGGGNSDPSEAPELCAAEGSDGVLVANEGCNKFYICANGLPVALKCPSGLFWNPSAEQCDWPENVECGDRVVPENEAGDNNNGDVSGVGDNEGNEDGDSKSNEESDSESNEDGDNNGENSEAEEAEDSEDNNSNGGGNSDPSEAPELCAAQHSDGILVANEECNKFYKCAKGLPVAFKCPSNLFWNPRIEKCDWPKNVDCKERLVPDPETDDHENESKTLNRNKRSTSSERRKGVSDPNLAPAICSVPGTRGLLIAHEYCNQYYICHDGKPWAFVCSGNLLYNPDSSQCDSPQNLDCGRRLL